MADLIFAFDPAIDRPIPFPDVLPPALSQLLAEAPLAALAAAYEHAGRCGATAVVICGRLLDPLRASPAQAAGVRRLIVEAAAADCRSIVVLAEAAERFEIGRALGDPAALSFVTPLGGVDLDVRGLPVEILSAFGSGADPADPPASGRRVVVGWDRGLWQSFSTDPTTDGEAEDDRGAYSHPAAVGAGADPRVFWVWGSRRCQMLPPGVHLLPALQPRGFLEASAGACCGLSLVGRAPESRGQTAPDLEWRSSWREQPTQQVGWRTLTIESQAGGDEELATTLWAALEPVVPAIRSNDAVTALELVRCAVACGTSLSRRVRVGEIAAETVARVRQLHDPRTFPFWCTEIYADPGESLGPLGHARSGSRPGSTTSFSSALADIVTAMEEAEPPPIPPARAREAGWLALELVESTA